MKILVLGAGKIGRVVAWDLAKRPEVEKVGIADVSSAALSEAKTWIASDKVVDHVLNITLERERACQLMQEYDAGVITLPNRFTSYKAIEAAIEAGLHVADILEEYHRRPDKDETEGLKPPSKAMTLDEYGESLHQQAIERGVTILDGMGFEPGLSNITLGEALRKMDVVESAIVRVGGIPSKETAGRHPLKYVISWAFEHVLREYMINVNVLRDGRIVEVEATSEREAFWFTHLGKDEELEAAITPGMPSIVYTRKEQLKNFVAKTIRWPGHWQGIAVLKECGLLNLEPIKFENDVVTVVPRGLIVAALAPKLRWQDGDADACVMYTTVIGTKNGSPVQIDYYMWDEADTENGISSMARVTGFTVATAAVFLANGEIKQNGIVAPEDAITGELYQKLTSELEKRNVCLVEKLKLNGSS